MWHELQKQQIYCGELCGEFLGMRTLVIVKGKTRIEKCTAETIYKLAKTLHVTMEELLIECFREDENVPNLRDFEIYKSNICHLVKDKGDIDFIIDILKENQIKDLLVERQGFLKEKFLTYIHKFLAALL